VGLVGYLKRNYIYCTFGRQIKSIADMWPI